MAAIGFIGLGNMGGPMAANLVRAGHRVTGLDLNAAALAALAEAGGVAAGSVAEAVAGADAVITMLPAGKHVRAVLDGPDGVFAHAKPGALLIDSSTIDVATARAMAEAAGSRGLEMLDAPVSGGSTGAAAGTLTFMVGVERRAAFERAQPLLRAMGKTIVRAGAAGQGRRRRCATTSCSASPCWACRRGSRWRRSWACRRNRCSRSAARRPGQCWALTSYCPVPGPVPASPRNRDYTPGFAVELMLKDLSLAMDAAAETGADGALGALARETYARLAAMGLGGKDFSVAAQAMSQGLLQANPKAGRPEASA